MQVFIRFERGRDDVIGPTYGPYDFVQVTYSVIRADRDGEEIELAFYNGPDGDWHLTDNERDETIFSDFVIYGIERPNEP